MLYYTPTSLCSDIVVVSLNCRGDSRNCLSTFSIFDPRKNPIITLYTLSYNSPGKWSGELEIDHSYPTKMMELHTFSPVLFVSSKCCIMLSVLVLSFVSRTCNGNCLTSNWWCLFKCHDSMLFISSKCLHCYNYNDEDVLNEMSSIESIM